MVAMEIAESTEYVKLSLVLLAQKMLERFSVPHLTTNSSKTANTTTGFLTLLKIPAWNAN
jgi:uncharacterized membrane protein